MGISSHTLTAAQRAQHGLTPPPSSLEERFDTLWQEMGGPPLEKERTFWAGRKWRFDMAYVSGDRFVAIEFEGGIYSGKPCPVCKQRRGGRHNNAKGFELDAIKYGHAVALGWKVFRLTENMLKGHDGAEWVRRIIEATK